MGRSKTPQRLAPASISRRAILYDSGMALGSMALTPLLARDVLGTLTANLQHHPAKAKHCIFLLMEGGPSHIDTFDPKPKLKDLHMTESAKERTPFAAAMNTGKRYYVRSPFGFRRAGKLGIEINENFRHFADVVDDVCFYRGLRGQSANHLAALSHLSSAFLMQAEMPGVADLSKESRATLEMYGVGGANEEVDAVARRCLLARRMVQARVRFVQVMVGGWDSHDDIEKGHGERIKAVDQPVTALLKDLKRTGLLEETLVIWAGEFGRSPDNAIRGEGMAWGRDHNAKAMTVWLAGGGAPRGAIVGATDEVGGEAVDAIHPIKDFHATLLHLLGLRQFSQTAGQPIKEIVA